MHNSFPVSLEKNTHRLYKKNLPPGLKTFFSASMAYNYKKQEAIMSKFLEILKDVLAVAVTVLLLVYIVKYRKCIDKVMELQVENSILRKYWMQNYKNTPAFISDGDVYII